MTAAATESLARGLREHLLAVTPGGPMPTVNPGHRVKFCWPPHPISYSFHVLTSDWTSSTTISMHGESFDVRMARTPFGVFGRCSALWLEAKGDTEEEMLHLLAKAAEPLFRRQFAIAGCLGS